MRTKKTPEKDTPERRGYTQTKIKSYFKSEDEIFMENNIWSKIKEEVEFQRYRDKLKMKELGMKLENGEYNYEAYNRWKESKQAWGDLSKEN